MLGLIALLTTGAVSVARAQDPEEPVEPTASDLSRAADFEGPCTASATISGGSGVNPMASGGVYTVPHSGSATYNGSVTPAEDERVTNGKVWVSTPPGIPSINLKDPWGEDEAVTTSDTGTVTWDIPSWVPGGIKLTVEGFHDETGGVHCRGLIQVKLDGGITDSPLGIGSLIMTALSVIGLAWSAWPIR